MSQKTNSMIKLALVFFIALLSFSIGTYVGKKYSDNQYKLAQLEPQKKNVAEHAPNEFATREEDSKAETKKPESANLTDSEVAKIAEEFAADETEIASTEADEKEIKTVASTPVVKQTQKVKTLPAKVPQQPIDREPASHQPAAKMSPPMHFTLQVGSFPTELEAQKVTKDLQGKGVKTSFVPAQVNGQTWYRVNVGLFGSVKEAQDYKKDFLEKMKLSSAIVQKVP